ncbi:DUF411 domain-containing protein [Luteimonas sp. RIT-PG2_3]
MKRHTLPVVVACVALPWLLASCTVADSANGPQPAADSATTDAVAPASTTARAPGPSAVPHSPVQPGALPLMTVSKHPSCGCCGVWIEHMQAAGFKVAVNDVEDLGPIKQAAGVPYAMGSCHTAQVDGYFIEGHVPASDVLRLLAERPDAKGLTVPGMPMGSPGMEHPDGIVQPYTVTLVRKDGSTQAFSQYPQP